MVKPTRSRRRRRTGERGAAVFIVVLVISMLTAIGVFAASSATLSTTSSGYARQATQTQHLTELGVHAFLAQMEDRGGLADIKQVRRLSEEQGITPDIAECPLGECTSWVRQDLEDQAAEALVDPSASPLPGSLGHAGIDWDVRIDVGDIHPTSAPGYAAPGTTGSTLKYCLATMYGRGALWPVATIDMKRAATTQAFTTARLKVLCGQ